MKGKGEKGGKSSSNLTGFDDSFPSVKPFECTRSYNKVVIAVNKEISDHLHIEDFDSITNDIEMLLSAVSKQNKTLNGEIQTLNSWQDRGKVGNSPAYSSASQPADHTTSQPPQTTSSTSQKRHGKGKLGDERPMKRMRTDSGRATYAQPISHKGKGKIHHQTQDHSENSPLTGASSSTTTTMPQIKVPKNITPLRFWSMVEPYCADITKDDIKYLEEQIKFCEDIGEFMRIPALGRHYTERWKEEDDMIEKKEAEKLNSKRKLLNTTNTTTMTTSSSSSLSSKHTNIHNNSNGGDDHNGSTGPMIKVDLEEDTGVSSTYGPLTQRLVQALLEENFIVNDDDALMSDANAYDAATMSATSLAKKFNIPSDALEHRIKYELESLGILDSDDDDDNDGDGSKNHNNNNNYNNKKKKNKSKRQLGDDDNDNSNDDVDDNDEGDDDDDDDDDDEILMEIRKKQGELKTLSQQNVATLRNLLSLATKEMERQEVKKKLSSIDAEILESYRKLQLCKIKRKTPNKRDKEMFFKLLQDRKSLVKLLH